MAIGEKVDYDVLRRNGIQVDDKGTISINPDTFETNLENVFIGGDALFGPSTVVEAIAMRLKHLKRLSQRKASRYEHNLNLFEKEKLHKEIVSRRGILRGFETEDAESERCLECNKACNICSEVCPNRANVMIKVEGVLKRQKPDIHRWYVMNAETVLSFALMKVLHIRRNLLCSGMRKTLTTATIQDSYWSKTEIIQYSWSG